LPEYMSLTSAVRLRCSALCRFSFSVLEPVFSNGLAISSVAESVTRHFDVMGHMGVVWITGFTVCKFNGLFRCSMKGTPNTNQ